MGEEVDRIEMLDVRRDDARDGAPGCAHIASHAPRVALDSYVTSCMMWSSWEEKEDAYNASAPLPYVSSAPDAEAEVEGLSSFIERGPAWKAEYRACTAEQQKYTYVIWR